MILNTNRNISPRLARSRLGLFTTATAMLAVLAINAGPRLVLAQSLPVTAPMGTTAPVALAGAPVPDGADPALPPDGPGPESGPRAKPAGGYVDSTPVSVASPSDPAAPASPPSLPVAPADPFIGVRPVPPVPPTARARKKNMSIEERLDRLERALEKLETEHGVKSRRLSGDSYSIDAGANGMGFTHSLPAGSEADMELKHAADEMKRALEQAQREVEAGQRAAETSARTAEQAMRDMAKLQAKDYDHWHQKYGQMAAEAPGKELEALREARESLEKQLQNISRQIKRLEQDQKRLKDPAQGQPDGPNNGPKPEKQGQDKTM